MTMTTTSDPADFGVDDVNQHLASYPDDVERVMGLEANGKARKGILEGPHAPKDDDQPTGGRRAQQQADEKSQGFLGDVAGADHEHAVQPAAEAAPDGVSTDPADAVVVPNGSPTLDLGTVPTVTDTPTPELTGEAYRRGYFGDVHTDENDNRPDLTLSGVLSQNQEK